MPTATEFQMQSIIRFPYQAPDNLLVLQSNHRDLVKVSMWPQQVLLWPWIWQCLLQKWELVDLLFTLTMATATTEIILDVAVKIVTNSLLPATKQVWIVLDHTRTTLVETILLIQAIYTLVSQQR
jgi:hypothetical protein